ncbi:MAG: redoxin family protein [Phycisphaerales bacterium JB059]
MTRRATAVPATLLAAAAFFATPALGAGPDCGEDCAMACCAERQACGEDCAKACCANLEELLPNVKTPELWLGADAPKLELAHFVKGESVAEFEKGHTYVVEFWATWCGPCIKAFPHLSELQKEMKDDVTFMGVNVWDTKKGESQGERIERVTEFVKRQGKKMSYTVAVEDGEKMSKTWLKPAGQDGIPAAFIVNGEGEIAWVGHPMNMDKPLEQIVAGEYDMDAAAKELREQTIAQAGYRAFAMGIMNPDAEEAKKAYKIGSALAAQTFADNAMYLNALAWPVLDNERVQHRDFEFAKRLAHRAAELTEWKDAGILDTYALAQFKTGDVAGAIKTQTKALELTPEGEQGREEMAERLEMFKAEG